MPSNEYEPFRTSRRMNLTPQSAASVGVFRQETFPRLIEAPRFGGGIAIPRPEWNRIWPWLAILAAIVALGVALAFALSSWAIESTSAPSIPRLQSSLGTTATAATTIEDLGPNSFIGQIPFVQQSRYVNTISGNTSASAGFVQGAREASVARYLQDIGVQVTLPYVSGASQTKDQILAWDAAVTELQRQEAVQAASARQIWSPPAVATGASMASTITFYACIGNGFCNNMASGIQAYAGAAACSYNLPFGTKFYVANDPAKRVFVCLDRGALAPTWVDVWFYDAADGWAWQAIVGTSSQIVIVD